MVDAESITAVVVGALLAILGGLGTLVVLVGALAGVLEWTALAWLLPVGFVAGVGLLVWGAVELLSSVTDVVSGDGLSGLTSKVDTYTLKQLFD